MAGLGPGKPLALLAYLAVRREARRDELVDLLWGKVSETNGRNAFRQALHRLRTALGDDVIPQDRDRVELAGTEAIPSDRDAFLDSLESGDIATAVDLYRGDFLEGFELGEPVFDGWVDAERTRLKSRFQAALQRGAEAALASGRWLEALQYVQRLTALAPYEESAAILEANVLVAAGRAPEALAALRRFTHVLRDQLDLAPSQKLREMAARIERAEPSAEPSPATNQAKEIPFVGREPEVARMMAFARGLTGEAGATLFIRGPAGIGKSRLVTEFVGRARSVGPLLVLRGRERPAGAALPYASVAEALRPALRAPGVAGTGRHLLAEAARILPELRDSFDLPDPGPIDSEGGRLRFFEGVAALLDSIAYEQPLCVVLDDMHNASASTVDLVGYLSARLRSSPVLLCLIHRDDVEAASSLTRIHEDSRTGGEERVDSVQVGPLDHDAIHDLIARIVLARGAEGQLDTDRLARSAAGNPLRAIELARRALNGEMPSTTPMPLRDILWARLQETAPSQRRVFFAAALLQRRCPLRLLASAAHLPELATYEAAQELERLGLLSQDGDSYVIAHDFTASFVADASGLAGRALLAGWAADALAAEPSPPSAELASLYSTAGQPGPAFAHARRAVYDAAALGASAEVHRLLRLALALAPDARSREQIESMHAAFGAGRRLLDAAAQAPSPVATEAAAEPVPAQAQPTVEAPRPQRRRPLLTPRLAALVLIGTIMGSIAVNWAQARSAANGPRMLRDSLVVIERGNERSGTALAITGSIDHAAEEDPSLISREELPDWTRGLQLPWIRPLQSASGVVAVERMTETGTDVYLMDGAAAEPVPVAIGPGTDAILGWSPDGSSLLVRRSRESSNGSFDADLWVYRIAGGRPGVPEPIDTSSSRSVEDEAAWAPDGSRIAWVAQTGPTHQRDVFVSLADGSAITNVTENPGEDYHISWSSDASLLAFTSDRDGDPDLFAIEFDRDASRLWRLTNTDAEEDFAVFSPDVRFVAFQSTIAGDAAVYIMPSLGGVPVRVTRTGGQFSILGWRGRPAASYIDRFRIIGPSVASVGDSVSLSIFASDRDGNSRSPDPVAVRVIESEVGNIGRSAASTGGKTYVLTPRRNGSIRVVASIPGWRHDTLTVQVGAAAVRMSSDDFSGGIDARRWLTLGTPRAVVRTVNGVPQLFPNADLQWHSGLLSRSVISLVDSVDIAATLDAPFASRPIAGALLTLALVEDQPGVDSVAPRVGMIAGITWDGETSRFTYSVGSQSRSDPLSAIGSATTHRVRIAASAGGNVAFYVDGRLRWTSSLRFLGEATDRRGRLWLAGKATGDVGSISDVVIARP